MTMLVPGALVGLALLAIPVLVHLFRPRKVRQTPFSSLRWLHLTQQRMARRIQWHQVLLFMLRAAFITLLVLALTRPLYSPGGATGLDRILVIDVSPSMGRQVEGRPRPIDAARNIATRLLEGQQSTDRSAVLLVGDKATVLVPWTTDSAPYRPALDALQPGLGGTNLDAAFDTIRSLLDLGREGAATEVFFLTDRAAGSWTPGAIGAFVKDLPADAKAAFKLVDLGLPGARNGWLTTARLRQTDAGQALRVEAASVGETPQTRTLHATGLNGVTELSTSMTLEPGRSTTIDLPLPASFERAGSLARLWLAPRDELEFDDELFVDVDSVGATRVLLIEAETSAEESQRPGFPLRTALAALAEAGGAAADAQITVRSPAAVTAAELAEADVILLTDVPGLTEAQAEALSRRVRTGAGAAIFLGPAVQLDNFNARFTSPLHPDEGLLPSALGGIVQATATDGGLSPWGHWNGRHPLLSGLLDPLVGDLAQVRSRAYVRFGAPVSATDEALAAFDDGTPALLARRVGAGRVVLFNASADDRWCDFPRRKGFVPLVDRLLGYLSPQGSGRVFAAGEAIALSLPADRTEPFVVRSPSGETLAPRVERSAAGVLLRLDAPSEAGFFAITSGVSPDGSSSAPTSTPFVVQSGRADSPLDRIDPETLRTWWQPASLEQLKPGEVPQGGSAAGGGFALAPWLVLAAGLVLLAEMFLVHWLCPRVNPLVAAAPPRRRGSVAPLRGREAARP